MSVRSILLSVFALALAGIACQPPAQEAAQLSEEDVAAIRSLIDPYEQAVIAGDYQAAAVVWADDVIRMPPNAPMIQGKAAMMEEFETRTYTVEEFDQAFEEIDGRDGFAYARGPYSITYAIPGYTEPVSDTGKSLAILRKQVDGSWVMTIACWNSDLPLPEAGT
jgi:ketosteroid isomerase-like protein